MSSTANKDGVQTDEIHIGLNVNGKKTSISGSGNGPIDAMINALKNDLELELKISDYHQHAISSGSDAKAVAYSEIIIGRESILGSRNTSKYCYCRLRINYQRPK